ncbi:uncharacterized protein LOC133134571 [Conger conger]|uniref:uncharacterized protein LOC133134571 n=1 Tax=Conger conger TaxID=82655 RepID=UPI002A59A20D|nr:uncharacterized protein LOC133134571 [Conger conger]
MARGPKSAGPPDYRSGDLRAALPTPVDYRSGDLRAALPTPPDYRSGDLRAALPTPPDYRSGDLRAALPTPLDYRSGDLRAALPTPLDYRSGDLRAALPTPLDYRSGDLRAALPTPVDYRSGDLRAALPTPVDYRSGDLRAALPTPLDYRSGDLRAALPTPLDYRSGDLRAALPTPVDYRSGDLRAALPNPPSSLLGYRSGLEAFREMWLDNPYEQVGLALSGDYVPMCSSPSWAGPDGPRRSSVRASLRRRSVLLISLWILTLLSFISVLGLYLPRMTAGSSAQDISSLQQDMSKLKETNAQLISELRMEIEDLDHFYSAVLKCSPNYSTPTVLNKIMDVSKKTGIVISPVWRWIHEATVDVTLDPDSAHPSLVLSENRKQVRLGPRRQDVVDSPRRFNFMVCVLGQNGFSSGRRYWEVGLHHKTDWTVGVAMSNADRKGSVLFRPRAGYWTIKMTKGEVRAMCEPPLPLPLRERPRTVGVFLDYEAGQVSFYNVETRTHIYSFTGHNFTKTLYPVFRPGLTEMGENSGPLVISPVTHFR